MEETQEQPKKSGMGVWPILIVVLIAVGGGAYFFLNQQSTSEPTSSVPNAMEQQAEPTSAPGAESENAMTDATNIEVEGGMFYFKPDEIRVKKGEKVTITFKNVKGMHDFVIDELNVKTDIINADETTTVEFTPDKTGTFEYYCSVGNHRQMGMKGTLIVE